MSKIINVKKAKMMYEKAKHQEFIQDTENKEVIQTVQEMIDEAEKEFSITKASFARIIKVSKSTLSEWAANNSRKEIVYWCLVGIKHKYNISKNANKFELDGDDYE